MLCELVVFISLLALQNIRSAQAQSEATCTDSAYSWSFNSLHQSPCDIGRALGAVCITDFSIPSLPSGYRYSGPSTENALDCVCNTVYYSVLNVCAACQRGVVSTWSDYKTNCTTTYQTFPESIPNGTAVPHYSYQSLLPNGTFDFAGAVVDTGPGATYIASSTSASLTSASNSHSSNSPRSDPTTDDVSSSTGPSSNTGVIVGGVVGGVLGLGIISALIFFLVHRRRHPAAVATTGPIGADMSLPMPSFAGENLTRSTYASTVYNKVYDPNDSSTFPSADGVLYSQQKVPAGYPQSYSPIQPAGTSPASTYRGIPEV
ncbi:hypothetical protein IW261DRAFT_1477794 [Armillaria novae-zelandiae]|uniref:Transmembrane protein n=1 Tax=Armillaria novae-zelandiae TaxID=153914 RepID=A0AA39P8F2_9AGAR|nr:hypothetical protein IW261DRAFT_1477794 [Armillaria novae-zelandiae]